MKVVFVVTGVESLAVGFLSSFLKSRGHLTELVFDPTLFSSEAVNFSRLAKFFDTKKELAREIVDKNPDLIGFSVLTINYRRALDIAREIKSLNKNIPIIFGGIHPTCVPDVVIKQKDVDMVCVGEGEYALLELLESLEQKKKRDNIKNIWFKKGENVIKNICRPLIDDLDSLPFPDKEMFYKVYPGFVKDDYYALSSRGCPFTCTYCANNVLGRVYRGLGRSLRRRSPKNIVDELALAKKNYSPKQITFVDDVFVQDITWLKDFVHRYKKRVNLPYVMLTHPRFVDYQVAKLLVDSGCFLLMLGIQSASEETRLKVLKRFETNKEIEKAAEDCHRAGLKFSIDHIFNIPGDGIKEYEEAIELYNKLRPAIINSYWLQYFPRTEIIGTAIKRGLMKKSQVRRIEEGLTSTSWVVGLGGRDTFNPELIYTNFQFFFTLLPVLPKRLMDKIIERRIYLMKFKPPIFLNTGLKFVVNLINGRSGIYLGIIKNILHFARTNLILKYCYKFVKS